MCPDYEWYPCILKCPSVSEQQKSQSLAAASSLTVDRLDRIEGRYLALDPPAEKLDMLRRLLTSGQRQQVLLAIQMIKGGGMPEALLPVLISLINSCDDPILLDKLTQMTVPYLAENEKHTKPSRILGNVGK